MTENKRRIARDPKTKELYNQFKDKIIEGSLKGRSLTEIFTLALTMGYTLERNELDELKKDYFIRPESFGKTLPTLIRSIAITEENNIEVLTNEEKVFIISEEYANSGIHYLSAKYSENLDDFTEMLLREIMQKIESDDILNKIDEIMESKHE